MPPPVFKPEPFANAAFLHQATTVRPDERCYGWITSSLVQDYSRETGRCRKSIFKSYPPPPLNNIEQSCNGKREKTTEKLTEGISSQPIIQFLEEAKDHLDGAILSSDALRNVEDCLFHTARQLKASGYPEVLKQFENNLKRPQNIYGNYIFSIAYEKLRQEEQKLKRQEAVKIWGDWGKLPIIERLVFEPEKVIDELKVEAGKSPRHDRRSVKINNPLSVTYRTYKSYKQTASHLLMITHL